MIRRLTTLLLVLALGLPGLGGLTPFEGSDPFSFSLRNAQQETPQQRAGLESALQPADGLEEGTLPAPLERRPLPNYEALVQRELAIIRAGRAAKPFGRVYWVGANGVTHAGKSSLMTVLAERLQADGFHTIHLAEDQIGLLDSELRDRWKRADRTRWLEWEHWLRWEDIGDTFRQINTAARQGPHEVWLKRLYNRETRTVRDAARPVTVFPQTIALYDGLSVLDPARYPPGTFDHVILLETTFQESARRVAGRAKTLGRAVEPIMETTQDMSFPFWERYVARVHPERLASSVYDVTDFTHPIQLVYRSESRFETSETGMPLVDEELATLRTGLLRARTAILEAHNGELAEDLARLQRGLYASTPLITLLFLDHPHALNRWLRAVANNLTVDDERPGDAWEAFELRREAQRHLRLLAEYPNGREPLRERHPEIIQTMRNNLTRDYTYRGPALVEEFRALARQTLEALGVPAEPAPTPAAGLEELSALPLGDIARKIVNREEMRHRRPAEWSRLHEALFLRLKNDQPRAGTNEWRVWNSTLDHLDATLGPELAAAGPGVKTVRPLDVLLQASRGYGRAGQMGPVSMESKLCSVANVVVALSEAYRVEERQGVPSTPEPFVAGLAPREYLRRYRQWLTFQWGRQGYLTTPLFVGGFSAPEDVGRPLGDPAPFGILSVLAARASGFEATTRAFPELARGLLDLGIREIGLIPAAEGHPPALLVTFRAPFRDRHSGIESPALAMALLKEEGVPWPALPTVETRRALNELTEAELLDVSERALLNELAAVEFDEARVRRLTVRADAPLAERLEQHAQMVRLALAGRLVPRSDYQYYTPEGIQRLARWLGRDLREQQVLEQVFQLELDSVSRIGRFRRLPATDAVRRELADQFTAWHEALSVLGQLGLPELEEDREAETRARLIARAGLLQLPEVYRPLVRFLLARAPDTGWLLHEQDARALANRLERARRVLVGALPTVQALSETLSASDRAVFLSEVNLGVLRALPVNPHKPFRALSMEQAQDALIAVAASTLGAEATRSPTALARRQPQRDRGEEALQAIQAQFWAHFPDDPEAMAQSLEPLERTAEALSRFGPHLAVSSAPPIRLEPGPFEEDLTHLSGWVAQALKAQAGAEPAGSASPSLDLFRALVQLGRLVRAEKPREAFQHSLPLVRQLQGEGLERVQRVRRMLAERIAHGTIEEIQTSPPEHRDALRQLVQETRALLQDYPDLAATLVTDEQRHARALLATYREPLESLRLIRECLESLAEAKPFPREKHAKLREHFFAQARRGAWPRLYQEVADLDPSLLLRGGQVGLEELATPAEGPIAAALRRGPVGFDVEQEGVVTMVSNGQRTPVSIPDELARYGFFKPGAHLVMVPLNAALVSLSGMAVVDQVGLSRQPEGVRYYDWRFVTKVKTFVNGLRTLPNDRKTVVLYRPRLIPLSKAKQWFPQKVMIQLEPSVTPLVARIPLLVRAAEANGGTLYLDDLLETSYAGQEVLLIAA